MSILSRLEKLEHIVSTVQTNVEDSKKKDVHKRVENALLATKVKGSKIVSTPLSYYQLSLNQRAELLKCPVDRLCKIIILENSIGEVACDPSKPLYQQKFIGVILQYITKLNTVDIEKHINTASKATGGAGGAKLTMAPLDVASKLTGFEHNGMTPFGSLSYIPLVVSRAILEISQPKYIWLGGGDIDLKLKMFLSELFRPGAFGEGFPAPLDLPCSEPRENLDLDAENLPEGDEV